MSAPVAPSADQCSYLNVTISRKGLSEFSHGKRLIFIPKEQVQLIEIKFGPHAERPIMQLILGLLLVSLGLAGLYLAINSGIRGFYWGFGLMIFGAIGALCLYETIKRGYYLSVISTKDTRKLIFKGTAQQTELSQFIKDASVLGYGFRDCINDKTII